MNASKIPIGAGFVGLIAGTVPGYKERQHFPGESVHLVALVPCSGGLDDRLLLDFFSGLVADHPWQAARNSYTWVLGVRRKRSGFVAIVDWSHPANSDASRRVRSELCEVLP